MSEKQETETIPPKDPSKLTFESAFTRRRILASYWLVILLAVPLWWSYTSISRLSLPESRIQALAGKQWHSDIRVHVKSNVKAHPVDAVVSDVARLLKEDLKESEGVSIQFVTDSKSSADTYEVTLNTNVERASLRGRKLTIGMLPDDDAESIESSRLRLASVLRHLLVPPPPAERSNSPQRVVKYSPRYRVSFTLLNEDSASGKAAYTWDMQQAFGAHLGPTIDRLSPLHNFTVESQVQFHAPLAFSPKAVEHEGKIVHGLTHEDLTVFVNSAEWTLSSAVSNDPVLHFVAFIPSKEHDPLYILDDEGHPTTSNAFILPQWGGIIILNQHQPHLNMFALRPIFQTFKTQLLTLLGVADLPPAGIQLDNNEPFSQWQFDALMRRRTMENVEESRDTLLSIVKLVNQIQNMPVGKDVKGDVLGALNALEHAFEVGSSSPMKAFKYSAKAFILSSKAFFNPGNLGMLYFPAEHKYAVYTPLFASIAAPLVAAVVREFLAWKKARREGLAERPKTD
ncbi:hypothetical protein QCA50_015485 [Cerrena zonata]|uniref:GPI transamidase component PIG-S n=1 Tax=Cerrena zonata TaxID=2478898 RepID=A0AAW0FV26_9APHY